MVPHGVDLNVFRRVDPDRREFGMPASSFVVGFVGSKRSHNDAGRKGLDILHQVLLRCKERIGDFHISFLGLGWEEEVHELRRWGISANYLGFIRKSQLPAFYSSIDTYVMTSRIEGGPCTVLEAMACQTPVVATSVGLVQDVIEDGVTGFSANVADVDRIAAAIQRLATSADLRKQMGSKARASMVTGRSWRDVLAYLDEPLRRMEMRGAVVRQPGADDGDAASKWCKAVHAADGALSVLLNCKRGTITPAASIEMLSACWEGLTAADIARGLKVSSPMAVALNFLRRPATPLP